MARFADAVLAWYDRHGRHDLPWQHPRDPYRVWVSEIMLQQTRVETVVPYFERFMARFPDVGALADAAVDEVLALWSGLGYYARARNLHRAAQRLRDEHGGVFPETLEAVMALPGVGRSTAGAVLALAGDRRHPILDGNVKRLLARHRAVPGWPGHKAVERQLWDAAEAFTPRERVADYTQAVMDLGATVCMPREPDCNACPVAEGCRARQQGAVADYPAPRPRRELPVRRTRMLLVGMEDDLLLEQRPPSGIWGGLWSLPECGADEETDAWCARHGLELVREARWRPFRHTFSHFHLEIEPRRLQVAPAGGGVMEPSGLVWYKCSALAELGLPAPVRGLVERLAEEPNTVDGEQR
ncbi:MAG TPA: A/G-specific adenine glycosylase [Gammaproteobacteria bacterium]|nr:A/G-specific adenine glycosylase [Gammaproteobacteria bacterium]